ncbi:MAG: THUMP domain-containing protein [Pseudomonadota bacterium]
MNDWNVVITIAAGPHQEASRFLATLGQVSRSDFFNVLTMKVEDIPAFLERMRQLLANDPRAAVLIGRAIPASQVFAFHGPEEFLAQARELVAGLAPRVAGQSFHVRLRRRGFKGRISSMQVEQDLDEALLQATTTLGQPAQVSFSDPQVIVALETVGNRAGLSLWERKQRLKYPFLRLD